MSSCSSSSISNPSSSISPNNLSKLFDHLLIQFYPRKVEEIEKVKNALSSIFDFNVQADSSNPKWLEKKRAKLIELVRYADKTNPLKEIALNKIAGKITELETIEKLPSDSKIQLIKENEKKRKALALEENDRKKNQGIMEFMNSDLGAEILENVFRGMSNTRIPTEEKKQH